MTIGFAVRVLVAAASSCLAVPAVAHASGGKPAESQQKPAAKDKDKKDGKPQAPAPPAPAPPKSYTDDDLKKYEEERSGKADGASSDDQPLAEDHPASGGAEDGEGGEGRAFWAERLKAERDRIAAAETAVADLEEKIAALRNDRDPTRVMEPFRLQAIEADIAKATGELEAANKELALARAALEAVLQDGRKRGVPNGWLREP
jgi:hypothetical protein